MKHFLAALSIVGALGFSACDNTRENAEADKAEGAKTSTESAAEEARDAAEGLTNGTAAASKEMTDPNVSPDLSGPDQPSDDNTDSEPIRPVSEPSP
ncbi:MAG: hypothetical protein JSR99_13935 [Proteobacteria bacterium]|nr:hypothetical protein [Pseudomonadota bacterium]